MSTTKITGNEERVHLTRREARAIERKTGVRPIAKVSDLPSNSSFSDKKDTLTTNQWDTGRIEKNELQQLLAVVPTTPEQLVEIEIPSTFKNNRSLTVRAVKPRALVNKKRRAVAGVGAMATLAIVASAFAIAPTANVTTDASLLSQVEAIDSTEVLAQELAEKESLNALVSEAIANSSPEVAAPEVAVNRTDLSLTTVATGAIEATPVPAPVAEESNNSEGTSSNSSSETRSNSNSNSNSGGSSSGNSSAPGQTAVGANVIETASQFIGVTPYVFGGSSPSGFDCSGLVKYVYGLHGISLPHSVSGQAAAGTRVSEPQPGDLVVFPNFHIGIYAGNGKMIDAPTEGRKVELGGLDAGSSYYFVRL